MAQLTRISRGVRAALRNLPSTFLIQKRASSTNHGLPNDWLKKSNPWKVVSPSSSYLNPNGITNPRPPFLLSSSLPYATSTDKDGVKGKDDEPHNRLIDDLKKIISFLKLLGQHSTHFQNNLQGGSTRSFIKVFKHGNPFGESVNLNNYNGYDELIARLDKVFKFNGELISPSRSWLVVYTDNEGDKMVVGDLPWQEFCNVVDKIYIYSRDEVEEMNP